MKAWVRVICFNFLVGGPNRGGVEGFGWKTILAPFLDGVMVCSIDKTFEDGVFFMGGSLVEGKEPLLEIEEVVQHGVDPGCDSVCNTRRQGSR